MLSRLLGMGVLEVVDRSRQEAHKWLDRSAVWPPRRTSAGDGPPRRDPSGFQGFLSAHHERFFAGPLDPATLPLMNSLAPGAMKTSLVTAENVARGRFDLLGYESLSFGDPIDWRLDPVSLKRTSLAHWSLINPADVGLVGDVKVVWELSRQQFLLAMGVAYRATRNEAHAERFASIFRAWTAENPVGLGINWASSLEAAMRIVSWSWALFLFRGSPHLDADLFAEVTMAIESHAVHIERFLSNHSSPNTHLTGEALGLFYAGVLFPEGSSANRWRSLGQNILEEQIEQQVLEDGVYFEQATAYQIYTIEIYLHYLILARRNHVAVSPEVRVLVQLMLDVLLALRRPDGGIPSIGDQDGGSLLPLTRRAPSDARGVFATAAGFFGRPDFAWAARGVQPEAIWLLGPAVVATFESCGAAPPAFGSRVFPKGGYVIMRAGWQRNAHHLVFDVGPLGCPRTAAHGHADLLSVQVSPFGEAFIVDPGTYVYASDRESRDHFRGSGAHSTITVDGVSQAEPSGPFGWKQRPAAGLRRFESTPAFDFADASHQAYERLADPVVHRRRVVFVKSGGYWVILDDLAGKQEHRVEQRFQFAPLPVTATGDHWVRAEGLCGQGLLIRPFAQTPLARKIETGSIKPLAGWVSPQYGQRAPAPTVVFTAVEKLPFRILTLLFPIRDSSSPPPLVRSIPDDHGVPTGLIFEETGEAIRFDDDTFTIESIPACKA